MNDKEYEPQFDSVAEIYDDNLEQLLGGGWNRKIRGI